VPGRVLEIDCADLLGSGQCLPDVGGHGLRVRSYDADYGGGLVRRKDARQGTGGVVPEAQDAECFQGLRG
jgi:hypothetical protein